MKVTILGSGTGAIGFPGVPDRFPPAYLIEWDREKLVFDCSEGLPARLAKVGIDYIDIRHLAISHSHPDHFALQGFIAAAYVKSVNLKLPFYVINIYTPEKIAQSFPQLLDIFWPERVGKLHEEVKPTFITTETLPKFIGTGQLSATVVYHGKGKQPAVAFRLEAPGGILAYSGDSGDCEGLRSISKDADMFICDARMRVGTRAVPMQDDHIDPYTAGDIAKAGNVKHLILTHYGGLDSDQAMIDDCRKSGYGGEVSIAQDFQVFEIKQ